MGLGNNFFHKSLQPDGKVIETREVHSQKGNTPKYSTESGIVTEASEVQPRKAKIPISFTDSGIVMEVIEVHSGESEITYVGDRIWYGHGSKNRNL